MERSQRDFKIGEVIKYATSLYKVMVVHRTFITVQSIRDNDLVINVNKDSMCINELNEDEKEKYA